MYRLKYEAELKKLKLSLLTLCAEVSAQIENSITSLISCDIALARETASRDDIIDNMELDIEKQCHKILLRENPVAKDFREVFAALKMITDLERIADQAEDIANIVIGFGEERCAVKNFENLLKMSKIALEMVSGSVNAFIKQDIKLADKIAQTDDELDFLFLKLKEDLIQRIKKNSEYAEDIIGIIMIAKYLERIGDHAVNICEWTKYFEGGLKELK
ncbi:MAG: phosphate signaling complex protein PhoU [Clostridia bacterium]|nr:phosphate signaling complex protein PhoU [Clostridia bacterium]